MLIFTSRSSLLRTVLFVHVLMAACGLGFYFLQNQLGVIGGKIALSKLLWLMFAISFWLVLPMFVLLSKDCPKFIGHVFRYLLFLMLARGLIELVMLYTLKNWSPLYGIAHDSLCMAGISYFLVMAVRTKEIYRNSQAPILFAHGLVTVLLFIPEIYFAMYMRNHFHTEGDSAVYFVPNLEEHNRVLTVTSYVDFFLTLYLPVFLWRWCDNKNDQSEKK